MDIPRFIAGRFRIEGVIGTGGMGTVYRATHLGLERPVAIKIIKPEFAADRDVADRFLLEARTMAKLRHPHAAMIFDAGNLPDGRHFIIMEFVEGITLSQALAREGPMSPARAVNIGLQICDVLEEAHQLGIIHRDLKPSNIMLNGRGVCVLDFGVAKVLASSTDLSTTYATTGSGQIVGTPRYMSPEQCLGQRVGVRSDLYSLGVLLYEMIAGRPPFVDALPSAVLVKQATAPPPPLFQVSKGVPRALALVVHQLLAKRADDRPRNAAVARAMLTKSLTRSGPERLETDPLAFTVASVSAKANLVLRAAAPLGVLFAFGALLYVWANRSEASPTTVRTITQATEESQAAFRAATGKSESPKKKDQAEKISAPPVDSSDRTREIAAALDSRVLDVQVVQTRSGSAMVAVSRTRSSAEAQFISLEQRGDSYRVVKKGQLDTDGFRRASWTSETVDVDEDGFEEVLFIGTRAKRVSGYRLVLYVPKSRQAFSLEVETERKRPVRALWSANLLKGNQTRFRRLLTERANAMLGQTHAATARVEKLPRR